MKRLARFLPAFLPAVVFCPLASVHGVFHAQALSADVDPRRPAAIKTEEVPVVPNEIFRRLAQYQNVRGAAFSGWAPDGSGILIQTRFGNASQLHRVYQPEGRREQITFFNEPVRGYFIPSSQDDALLLSMSRGGNENYQVYFHNHANFKSMLLTDGKSRNRIGPVLDNGSKMIITSTMRNGRDTDIYVADPRKPNSMELIFETNREFWYAADWSSDGKTLLLGRYVSINESYMALLDVESRKRTDLPLPGDQKAAIGSMAFSKDGESVFLTTDAGGEFRRLARLHLASGEYEWLTSDIPWDVSNLIVDPKTGRVAFAVNDDGASKLFVVSAAGGRREMPISLGIVSELEFSPDGDRLGFTLSRPDAPSDAYSLDLPSGDLTRWTYSEVGGLNPNTFVLPTRIEFPSFDKRMIPAYYYRPPAASSDVQAPVLIAIHGGPESQYRPYFSSQAQFHVNELGMAVIYPNVRGSSGYGKTYVRLDNGPLREDSVKDIGALLDWIAEQPELDASRVAVTGGSYGGYMVLASLIHFGDRIRAGMDFVGIASFTTFLKNTAAYRRDLRRAEYGDERDPVMQEVFHRINPTSHAEKIRSALLVSHGKNDPRVPFSEAEQIARKVREQGRPVWTVFADNEGHGFAKKDNYDYQRAVEVLFLKTHLNIAQ